MDGTGSGSYRMRGLCCSRCSALGSAVTALVTDLVACVKVKLSLCLIKHHAMKTYS